MGNSTVVDLQKSRQVFEDQLTSLLWEGAQRMLATATERPENGFVSPQKYCRRTFGVPRAWRN